MKTKHKTMMIVGSLLAGFLLVMAVGFGIFAGNGSPQPVVEKNVSIDLPMGGKAVIGELSRSASSTGGETTTTLSNVMIDIPDVEKGTVEKIVFSGHAADLKDMKSIRTVEIFNAHMTGFEVESIVYTGLELDFPLLMSVDLANSDNLKKLLQSFRMKSSDVRNFVSKDGASFVSVAHSGAGACSAASVKDLFMEDVRGGIDGQISFAIRKSATASMEMPNTLLALDVKNEKDIENVLDGMKIEGFSVDDFSVSMGDAKLSLANFTFNMEDADASGKLDLKFRGLEIPSELLMVFGMNGIWNGNEPMKVNGDMTCDFTDKGEFISADQKAALSVDNYVSADYAAKTLFNMKNYGIVNERTELVVKDAGMVESLPLPMRMFLFAQAAQVDPAVAQGVKTFLETPGKTMTMRAKEISGDMRIEISVE